MVTGFVRKLDDLNRIVIPKPFINVMGWEKNEQIEMLIKNNVLIAKKYQPCCAQCGSREELVNVAGATICRECLAEINYRVNG